MVISMRIDERLLHGQVAVTWLSQLGPDSILIANDDAAGNEMQKMALKMVKPEGVKMAIRTVEAAAKTLNDPRAEKLKIFVIVRTIGDALKLAKMTDTIRKVNVGGVRKKEGARLVAPAVYLNDDDLACLKELTETVDSVEFQMVPSDTPKDARSFL